MSCDARYASAAEYDALMCAGLDLTDPDVLAEIESVLDIAASDVHVALAAVGACDCSLASWATQYLKKLNIIDAAVIHNCPCGRRMSDAERESKALWLDKQFELIYTGQLTVCAGDTGANYPAFGTAEMNYTPWSEQQIIDNEARRHS